MAAPGCQPRTFLQPCDWETDACANAEASCLLGQSVYFVPYFPIEQTFPYPCAAGFLGSNDSAFQISSDCAGLISVWQDGATAACNTTLSSVITCVATEEPEIPESVFVSAELMPLARSVFEPPPHLPSLAH